MIIDVRSTTPPPLTGTTTVPHSYGKESQGLLAVRADGLAVLARGPSARTEVSLVDGVGMVDVRHVGDGRIRWATRPPTRAIEGPEAWLGDISDKWMVWGEGESTELSTLDATFWAAPVADPSRKRRVGESPRFTKDHVSWTPIGYYRPTIFTDRLVWAATRAFTAEEKRRDPGHEYGMSLYAHRLDGAGRTVEEAHGGYLPGRDRCVDVPTSSLTYARTATSDRTLPTGSVEVYRRIGNTRSALVWKGSLPAGAKLDDLAVCGDTVAVIAQLPDSTDGTNGAWLALVRGGQVVQEQRFVDAHVSDLALTRTFLALTTDTAGQQRTYLMDRTTRRTFLLEDKADGCSEMILSDAFVVWGSGADDDPLGCVTKVATLP